MDTLLSVLLFLNTIHPNNTYLSSDIASLSTAFSLQIQQIESIPPQIQQVMMQEAPLVPTIIVIDDNGVGNAN